MAVFDLVPVYRRATAPMFSSLASFDRVTAQGAILVCMHSSVHEFLFNSYTISYCLSSAMATKYLLKLTGTVLLEWMTELQTQAQSKGSAEAESSFQIRSKGSKIHHRLS